MTLNQPVLWLVGRVLLFSGLLGMLALMTAAAIYDWPDSTALSLAGKVLGTIFLSGGLIVWSFSIRFYDRVSPEISGPRSLAYLAVLIGLNWLSPFLFIRLEGRLRFFGREEKINRLAKVGVCSALWLLGIPAGSAEPPLDPAVGVALRKVMSADVAEQEWLGCLQAGLWNPELTAMAMSVPRAAGSLLFVFIRQEDGSYIGVDVGKVEVMNLGKLGTVVRKDYDRCETVPTEWLPREDGRSQVVLRTRAWRAGKRYTVSERLVIEADGVVRWR